MSQRDPEGFQRQSMRVLRPGRAWPSLGTLATRELTMRPMQLTKHKAMPHKERQRTGEGQCVRTITGKPGAGAG